MDTGRGVAIRPFVYSEGRDLGKGPEYGKEEKARAVQFANAQSCM